MRHNIQVMLIALYRYQILAQVLQPLALKRLAGPNLSCYKEINKVKQRKAAHLQNIYFLLHDHNLTIIPNDHSHELLGLDASEYEPFIQNI